jgi:hypothetical protein
VRIKIAITYSAVQAFEAHVVAVESLGDCVSTKMFVSLRHWPLLSKQVHACVLAGTLPFNWPSFARMTKIYLSKNKLEGQVKVKPYVSES